MNTPNWLRDEILEIKSDVKFLIAEHHLRKGKEDTLSGVGKFMVALVAAITSAVVSIFAAFISRSH